MVQYAFAGQKSWKHNQTSTIQHIHVLHLSDEIYQLQEELQSRLVYFQETAKGLDLPLVSEALTPIFFIGAGESSVGYELCKRLLNKGFYTNVAAFPSVPYNRAGLRMTITCHHTYEDIDRLLNAISVELDEVLNRSDYTRAEIFKAFKMKKPVSAPTARVVLSS